MTSNIEQQILSIIENNNGIKASDIASKLNIDKTKINRYLYGKLKNFCYQDSSYKWYSKKAHSQIKSQPKSSANIDKTLSSICRYYLNCISLEENSSISLFLQSKYTPDYIEIDTPSDACFEKPEVAKFLNNASQKAKQVMYLGYPVQIYTITARTGQKYQMLAPVLLYALEYNSGNAKLSSVPSINKKLIENHAKNEKDSQLYELIELDKQLGLSEISADIDISDIISRLQNIRKWEWKEKMDPYHIDITTSIQEIVEDGIYNRAVILTTDKSPYTIGLEAELSALSVMAEEQYRGTALYDWIHNTIRPIKIHDNENIIEVLPLNTEQEISIQKAVKSNLSIITGPPGTGKSQVVTNLLINMAYQGKTVLFSSKNNKAVDVVEARVNEIGKKPILLRIGNNQYATKLAELITSFLSTSSNQNDINEYKTYKDQYNTHLNRYQQLNKSKDYIIELRNKLDRIEQSYCYYRDKVGQFFSSVDEDFVDELYRCLDNFKHSYEMQLKEKQSCWIRAIWPLVQKRRKEKFEQCRNSLNNLIIQLDMNAIVSNLSEEKYRRVCINIDEIVKAIKILIEYKNLLAEFNKLDRLEKIDEQLWNEKKVLSAIAYKLWNKWLITRPLNITLEQKKIMRQYVTAIKLLGNDNNNIDWAAHPDLVKQYTTLQKNMANYLPCWAVTSLSARGKIPFQSGLFDLLVIDEASQCDIASILPLLYRAKRVVIIGDGKQLRHISTIAYKQDLNLLNKYKIDIQWAYSVNSLYDRAESLIVSNEDITQLLDHHRSCSDIIGFSNSEFYNNRLRVATNYSNLIRSQNFKLGITWKDISGETIRPKEGGAYNYAEAKKVIDILQNLLSEKYAGSIGVVTPFKKQAELIRQEIEKDSDLASVLYTKNSLLIDTVHRFQGDERDIIIFSTVISNGTQQGALNFLSNTGNLFNVAITRAKSSLIVVGDKGYCATCNVSYLKNFVNYVNNDTDRKSTLLNIDVPQTSEYPKVDNMEQVSEWEIFFYKELYKAGIKTIPQLQVDKYRLDLAILLHEHKLDIEVDGEFYHKNWNGELCYRDQLRNQRLIELGWSIKRFWVYQIRDNLKECIEEIKDWLKNKE